MAANGSASSPSLADWLARCRDAADAMQPIPEASLFRRMMQHDCYYKDGADVYCSGAVVPKAKSSSLACWDGLQLASSIDGSATELRLLFDTAGGPLQLDGRQVEHLRSFLQVTVIDALLQRMHDGADLQVEQPMKRLQTFDSFYTVCAGGDDASQALSMVLAPDESGRRLVAAFTAQDALQQFVAASSSGGAVSLVSARLSGKELFEQVASTDDLDGIVFNASGPGPPIPLSRDAAYAVLKG